MTLLTTSTDARGILPVAFGQLITDPLQATAVAFDSRVSTTITTGSKEFRAPRLVEDAAASWVEEGAEIAPSDPTLDEVSVIPTKVGGLSVISRELAEDSSPKAQELVGESLARALVVQVDRAFFGALPAPAAQGLGSIEPTEVGGALDSLDLVHDAKAAIAAEGGNASAILAHPQDVLTLAKLRDESGSNRSLLEDTSVVAGVPVVSTRFATQGELWVVDAAQVLTVLREDTTVAVSSDAFFSSDRVAVRATTRVGFGFLTPKALAKITVTA